MSDAKPLGPFLNFELPTLDERLFRQDGDWGEQLVVDPLGHTYGVGQRTTEAGRWDLYADGYKRAGDILVDAALSQHATDSLLYPILGSYRHFLEMRLKGLLVDASVLIEPISLGSLTKHPLTPYWKQLRHHLEQLSVGPPAGMANAVEACIAEFDKCDSTAQATRYPFDLKGNPTFQGLQAVNLVDLKAAIQRISNFLALADTALDHETEWRNSMY